MHRNVEDVVSAWESGKDIETIKLESEGTSQESLHELAFAMVKAAAAKNAVVKVENIGDFRMAVREVVKDTANVYEYTTREIISAESLAFLTLKHGWSLTVSRNHELITLKKATPTAAKVTHTTNPATA